MPGRKFEETAETKKMDVIDLSADLFNDNGEGKVPNISAMESSVKLCGLLFSVERPS